MINNDQLSQKWTPISTPRRLGFRLLQLRPRRLPRRHARVAATDARAAGRRQAGHVHDEVLAARGFPGTDAAREKPKGKPTGKAKGKWMKPAFMEFKDDLNQGEWWTKPKI